MGKRAGSIVLAALVLASLGLVLGCGSTAGNVPRVDPTMLAWARDQEQDPEALARGRTLYLTACTGCHSPVPIPRHDPEAWAAILPRMSAQAGLEPPEYDDLRAYLRAVLAQQATVAKDPGS